MEKMVDMYRQNPSLGDPHTIEQQLNENAKELDTLKVHLHIQQVTEILQIDKGIPAKAGFHAAPLSWSNWNLEKLVFQEEGKQENLKKNSQIKARTNNKLNP